MIKTFVLDTNVLLHSAQSIESFDDNDVVIPMAVVEELDKFKKNSDELGRNARQVIRHLDALRKSALPKTGQLSCGISLSKISHSATGKLFVLSSSGFDPKTVERVDALFSGDLGAASPDNRILRVAAALDRPDKPVIFISKDINLRLKADSLGLRVMDYERGKVNYDSLYRGFREITVPAATLETLYRERQLEAKSFHLLRNEFAVLHTENEGRKSAIARCRQDGWIQLLDHARTDRVWNVQPRNKEQRMALDLLLDPDIRLVTLVGGAGTGKTLLALAAALMCSGATFSCPLM